MSDAYSCGPIHTNLFVSLNGIPYLVAEYLDRNDLQQLDSSLVKSSIYVDQTESMRAIIDINVDDIGKKNSGTLATRGNRAKQRDLLNLIDRQAIQLDHQLDVIKKSLIVRVNYQVENLTTHQVIRSMVEDFRISKRNYFVHINPTDVSDNAIVANFSDSLVSTINNFTHGYDRMIMRITNVQLLYECVKREPPFPYSRPKLVNEYNGTPYTSEAGYWYYHNRHQHTIHPQNVFDNSDTYNMPVAPTYHRDDVIDHTGWVGFNRYYHFTNHGHDMILHQDEITDPRAKIVLIPCGLVAVNRAFIINPGHRLIFKFNIWKNDVTIFNDTSYVAKALKAPFVGDGYIPNESLEPDCEKCDPPKHHHHHCNPCNEHYHDLDYEHMMDLMHKGVEMDHRQNHTINKLLDKINELEEKLNKVAPPEAQSFTVSFFTPHGATPASQVVIKGDVAAEPAALRQHGYTFTGWYKEPGCINQYTFTEPITEDTTIYAGWMINTYTITFNDGGHALGIPQQYVPYNGTGTRPAAPTLLGYTFKGWFADSECTTEFDFEAPITSNVVAYAKWQPFTITITYALNGGTGTNTQALNYNDPIHQPGDPVREGYHFEGWYVNEDLSQPFVFDQPAVQDIVIYAKWRKESSIDDMTADQLNQLIDDAAQPIPSEEIDNILNGLEDNPDVDDDI